MNRIKIPWLTVSFAFALIASLFYCYRFEARVRQLSLMNVELKETTFKLQTEKRQIQQELNDCNIEKEQTPNVTNGRYTPEQMDEIDRRLQRSLSNPYKN